MTEERAKYELEPEPATLEEHERLLAAFLQQTPCNLVVGDQSIPVVIKEYNNPCSDKLVVIPLNQKDLVAMEWPEGMSCSQATFVTFVVTLTGDAMKALHVPEA